MKVLVCPLDWGLGHAARCIPLIRALRALGHEVEAAASGPTRLLLEREVPELRLLRLPGYGVRYARDPRWLMPKLASQLPGILWRVCGENRWLAREARRGGWQVVLSDCRYGLFHREIPCVLINHQIFLRLPESLGRLRRPLEKLLHLLNRIFLARFSEVWVPDFPGHGNLSGELSHGTPLPSSVRYIGPLTRFAGEWAPYPEGERESEIRVLAVISGAEPQRSLLEEGLRRALAGLSGTRVLVRGLPGDGKAGADTSASPPALQRGSLNVFDHLDTSALLGCLRQAETVVARSGYSTVMDLAALRHKHVVLIPTPNQTEQEYLARHLEGLGACLALAQHRLDKLHSALAEPENIPGFGTWPHWHADDLEKRLAAHPLFRTEPG